MAKPSRSHAREQCGQVRQGAGRFRLVPKAPSHAVGSKKVQPSGMKKARETAGQREGRGRGGRSWLRWAQAPLPRAWHLACSAQSFTGHRGASFSWSPVPQESRVPSMCHRWQLRATSPLLCEAPRPPRKAGEPDGGRRRARGKSVCSLWMPSTWPGQSRRVRLTHVLLVWGFFFCFLSGTRSRNRQREGRPTSPGSAVRRPSRLCPRALAPFPTSETPCRVLGCKPWGGWETWLSPLRKLLWASFPRGTVFSRSFIGKMESEIQVFPLCSCGPCHPSASRLLIPSAGTRRPAVPHRTRGWLSGSGPAR